MFPLLKFSSWVKLRRVRPYTVSIRVGETSGILKRPDLTNFYFPMWKFIFAAEFLKLFLE